MNILGCVGALMGATLLSLSPLWAQSLEKIVEGAKKEGKVRVGLTVRWEEGGKPGAKKSPQARPTRARSAGKSGTRSPLCRSTSVRAMPTGRIMPLERWDSRQRSGAWEVGRDIDILRAAQDRHPLQG